MDLMKLQRVLEAFVLHWKGMSIVQALSTVQVYLYDGGRPKIYYEYRALMSIFNSVCEFLSNSTFL